MANEICGYSLAWVGPCKNSPTSGDRCDKHAGITCRSCGNPATHDCGETGQFVCGEPLCEDCEHTIFADGTNGGIGFNAQNLPEGMKRHCKKIDQRFLPWYAREDEEQSQ